MRELTVVTWKLEQIRAYGKRLRKNDAAVGRMVRSIETYGFCIPVLVTAAGEAENFKIREIARVGKWVACLWTMIVTCISR